MYRYSWSENLPVIDYEKWGCFFIEGPVVSPKTNAPIGVDAISVYYIPSGSIPMKAEGRGLLYDDTPAEIADAFSSNANGDHQERIFVIHSMDVRNSLVEPNSFGKFYLISIFDLIGSTLRRDELVSDWFGADYSWLSDGRRVIYKFPYQSRKDIQQAMNPPFALLMDGKKLVHVRLKRKSYMSEVSNVRDKTKIYLISGDHAIANKATAGWC